MELRSKNWSNFVKIRSKFGRNIVEIRSKIRSKNRYKTVSAQPLAVKLLLLAVLPGVNNHVGPEVFVLLAVVYLLLSLSPSGAFGALDVELPPKKKELTLFHFFSSFASLIPS